MKILEYVVSLKMPKKINIKIQENLDFLRIEHSKAIGSLKRDRIKALIYVKEGKYHFQSAIGKKLGRTEKTIRNWLQDYSTDGYASYVTVKSGGNNTRTISKKALHFISEKMQDSSTTITSYVELQKILEQELCETVAYAALYSHCRRNYKSKLKVARKSHYKKDEKAEELFKKP